MSLPLSTFSCPYGHALRPEKAHGAGGCDTCLAMLVADGTGTGTRFGVGTGKSYLLRRVAFYALDAIAEQTPVADDVDPTPTIYEEMDYNLLKKPNYAKARMTSVCTCANRDDPAHNENECYAADCTACAVVRCPRQEPLHFHHDGCPAGCDA